MVSDMNAGIPALDSGRQSDGVHATFAGADSNGFFNAGNENLAVADPAGLGRRSDCFNGLVDKVVAQDDFNLHLWQEVDNIFSAAL